MKRRSFIQYTAIGAGVASLGLPVDLFASTKMVRLVILHTNDTHSRIDPFPQDSGKNAGLGGVVKRSAMIQRVRSLEKNVLLLDSGDIFQGTPYFNMFGGELEMKAMSSMKYDTATMGNHDFDNGVEGFVKQLPHANFPFVISNYNFKGTALEGKTKPCQIFKKENVKIGVFGLGIELNGLVPDKCYTGVEYLDPLQEAKDLSTKLRDEEKCDLIICLSHLGYKYNDSKISDVVLAAETDEIDIILGGHTHTFMVRPEIIKNRKNRNVLINQVGFGGMYLGRLDINLQSCKRSHCYSGTSMLVR